MADHAPCSRSQKSCGTPTSDHQPFPTPKLLLDPPPRRSSLAFSRAMDSPLKKDKQETPLETLMTDVDHVPTQNSYFNMSKTCSIQRHSPPCITFPGHATSFQSALQAAEANLQFDMHFAASPTGSIGARIPQPDLVVVSKETGAIGNTGSRTTWRYSAVPKILSTSALDVREPLPDTSPAVPALMPCRPDDCSNFASPASNIGFKDADDYLDLPPLPRSSPASSGFHKVGENDLRDGLHSAPDDISELTQPMTGLKVRDNETTYSSARESPMDDSPIIDHLRRRSTCNHDVPVGTLELPDRIFLSQSARAAAESAKTKRNLLRQAFDQSSIHGIVNLSFRTPTTADNQKSDRENFDPNLHRYLAATPCPDPLAHVRVRPPKSFINHLEALRTRPSAWANASTFHEGVEKASLESRPMSLRLTPIGSSVSFPRRMISPSNKNEGPWANDPYHRPSRNVQPQSPHATAFLHRARPAPPSNNQSHSAWHSPKAATSAGNSPVANLYSFSTAAAKATGESVAPDSRIRDSYRTDTLTPFVCPPGRFKKHRVAATSRPYGTRVHIDSGTMQRRLTQRRMRSQPQNRSGMEFRSSPPRPLPQYMTNGNGRKRGLNITGMPEFDIAEDDVSASADSANSLFSGKRAMPVDEETRAAVRLSLFGPNTPECLQGAREGVRELSPNVNIWRKGLHGGPNYRKKRRPSYWDDDLEEVRMSPAGRGGIASSPTISKRSMIADLDNASIRADVVATNDKESDDESSWLIHELEDNKVAEEIMMTDAMELEA